MQRQKTIAKWLAIILLLTLVVAAYLVLNAVLGNKTTSPKVDIAGAGDQGNAPDISPDDPDVPVFVPTYSSFPRAAETVGELTVSHVGGENDDTLLDCVYYEGKRLIIFSSLSEQYDVRAKGIHMAIFDRHSLRSVTRIADVDETFVKSYLVQNGLLVITKTADLTRLRLYDGDCKLIAENSCPAFSSYALHLSGTKATLFTADDNRICATVITKSLDIVGNNFLYSAQNAELLYTLNLEKTTLIAQSENIIRLIEYDEKEGFICKSELLNCRFMQLLPSPLGATKNFVIAAETDAGVMLTNIDGSTLKPDYSYLIEGATSAACLVNGNNIIAVAGKTAYKFCSHLELQDTFALSFANGNYDMPFDLDCDDIIYSAINGENGIFLIENSAKFAVVSINDSTVKPIFAAAGKYATIIREPVNNGRSDLSVAFVGNSANDFSYMCFGSDDVFYVTLPSRLTTIAD